MARTVSLTTHTPALIRIAARRKNGFVLGPQREKRKNAGRCVTPNFIPYTLLSQIEIEDEKAAARYFLEGIGQRQAKKIN